MKKETYRGMIQGNEKSFDEFVDEYRSQIFAYALTVLRDREVAEEVSQKTMIKVVEKINQLKDYAKFKPWLFRITYRQCLDELKLKENKYEVVMDDFLLESYGEEMKKEENSEVWEALNELSDRNRALIVGKYIYELSEIEIAKMMEIPRGTVKSRLYSARKELKGIFEKRHISPTSLSAVLSPTMIPWVIENFKPSPAYTSGLSGAALTKKFIRKRAQRIAVKSVVVSSVVTAAVAGYIYFNNNEGPSEIAEPLVVQQETKEEELPQVEEKPSDEQAQASVQDPISCSIDGVQYTTTYVNTALYLKPQTACDRVNRITVNGVDTQDVSQNGLYTLQIWDNEELLDSRSVEINNIDITAPTIISQSYNEDNDIYTIQLNDDLSGLTDTIEFYENGVASTNVSYSKETGQISFVYHSDVVYSIAVRDNAGNLIKFSVKEK